jgi:hypothetical protein
MPTLRTKRRRNWGFSDRLGNNADVRNTLGLHAHMITREQLYELVWSSPMTKVAEQFQVSGSYMAQVCSVLRVPRPDRGYWAKLAVGKAPERQPLPEARPGDQVRWSKESGLGDYKAPKPDEPPEGRRPRARKSNVTGTHGLIRGAKAHFESGRPVEEGKYLKPYKRLLVDVTAAKTGLDNALKFASDLFNALESEGHNVVLAPNGEQWRRGTVEWREQPDERRHHHHHDGLWSPFRPTVVYIGTVAIGLAVIEMSEDVLMRYVGNGKYIRDSEYVPRKASRRDVDHSWTTTQEVPTGRLRLVAYSPYWRVSSMTSWQETKGTTLTRELGAIVKAIERAAVELVEQLKEADRQAERARLQRLAEEDKRRREEDLRQIQQSAKDSQAHLHQIIRDWADAANIERFFQGVFDRAADLPEDTRQLVLERLRLARDFIGTQNPIDFFLSWKTPDERYVPLSSRSDAGKTAER